MSLPIVFEPEKRTFTIETKNTTYQMMVDDHDVLLHLYYGRKSKGSMDYLLTYADRGFSGNPYDAEKDRTYSFDCLPFEYPTLGNGDYRGPAFVLRNGDGSLACDLRYESYDIKAGKYGLSNLPAVYANEKSSATLRITLADRISGARVNLLYGVLPQLDIITRAAEIENVGEALFVIEKALSASIDFVSGQFDLVTFYGRHGMERTFERRNLPHGVSRIESRRGMSSHQYSPVMLLLEKDATETAGTCYGMQFVYSGPFTGFAEKDQFSQTRFAMGLMDEQFSYTLAAGEKFTTPEVILTCSVNGMETLSHNFHRCLRHHVCRGKWRDAVRPVLLNSWEAFYFNFTGEDIMVLAEQAKALGMDLLVMDDGWFGLRNDDDHSLGDWQVNEKKLGGTLAQLIKNVNDRGLMFGIWVEPEMVNEDSDLYRQHPDWALAIPGRNPVRGRDQLVLDFSRKEVVDHIFDDICKVLDQGVEYLKWDYNRCIADVYSVAASEQGRVLYDYILGLYDFLERLNQRYPDLLIEGCSGGGGRFDAGMLYYTPQIWCSDNTDAMDRLSIQYGTSFAFPVSAVGAHVSAVPNEQCGRITPLDTRGVVAMSGTFGYELNPEKLSADDKRAIWRQVTEFKKYAPLIQNGLYYRLSSPLTDRYAAWAFVSEDGKEALVNIVLVENHFNDMVDYVKLRGLLPGSFYTNSDDHRTYPSDALMQVGIPVPKGMGDYQAFQWHFVLEDEAF